MPRVDKEARLAYQKEYYHKNAEKQSARRHELREANKEQVNARQREVYYPREKARKQERAKELALEQKLAIFAYYSSGTLSCAHCGIDDLDVLCLDHVNGGGSKQRKINPHTYRFVLKNGMPKGFQVLCFNCNWKKRLNEQ